MIDVSKILLTNDFRDSKYFGIYFNSLRKYQEYFLIENKPWIKSFLTNLIIDQLHVYHLLLSVLKKHHYSFFQELLTDEYINITASIISLANANRFKSIQEFIRVLGKERLKLIEKLDWETLAKTANKAEGAQLTQVAVFINALGTDKEKQKLIEKLDWETLAKTANKAEVAQLTQVADFLNALGTDKEKLKLIEKLEWETLAKTANKAEVAQLKQIADFINALGTDKEKQKLIEKLEWETLAKTANKAEVAQFSQLEAFLNALGTDKEKLKLIEKLDWETLAKTANKAEVTQLTQVAVFINALGTDKEKLSSLFNIEGIIHYSKLISPQQIASFCIIISSFEEVTQDILISKIDWLAILKKITFNHNIKIRDLSHVLYYQNKKQISINQQIEKDSIAEYFTYNKNEIIRYATQYFVSPNDFQITAKLLKELFPFTSDICNRIIKNLRYKIVNDFNISPSYYHHFSNLLDAIHQINPALSNFIIRHKIVKEKLYNSFQEDDLNSKKIGLQSLLITIKVINPQEYEKINNLECIKKLELTGITLV